MLVRIKFLSSFCFKDSVFNKVISIFNQVKTLGIFQNLCSKTLENVKNVHNQISQKNQNGCQIIMRDHVLWSDAYKL